MPSTADPNFVRLSHRLARLSEGIGCISRISTERRQMLPEVLPLLSQPRPLDSHPRGRRYLQLLRRQARVTNYVLNRNPYAVIVRRARSDA